MLGDQIDALLAFQNYPYEYPVEENLRFFLDHLQGCLTDDDLYRISLISHPLKSPIGFESAPEVTCLDTLDLETKNIPQDKIDSYRSPRGGEFEVVSASKKDRRHTVVLTDSVAPGALDAVDEEQQPKSFAGGEVLRASSDRPRRDLLGAARQVRSQTESHLETSGGELEQILSQAAPTPRTYQSEVEASESKKGRRMSTIPSKSPQLMKVQKKRPKEETGEEAKDGLRTRSKSPQRSPKGPKEAAKDADEGLGNGDVSPSNETDSPAGERNSARGGDSSDPDDTKKTKKKKKRKRARSDKVEKSDLGRLLPAAVNHFRDDSRLKSPTVSEGRKRVKSKEDTGPPLASRMRRRSLSLQHCNQEDLLRDLDMLRFKPKKKKKKAIPK